jgi:predicted amidohydrolase YtcJ
LSDKSLHTVWVNSLALKLAGVDRNTPDPAGGIIQRTQSGEPSGILYEAAVSLVQAAIPQPGLPERLTFLRDAQQQLIAYGVTGVTDFDPFSSYESLAQLQKEGELKLRVSKGIPFEKLDWAIEHDIHSGDSEGRIRWGAVKLFADGALGPQTAAMLRPYEGSENNYGKLQLTADELFETGIKASRHGLSLAVHAIGDRATHEVLNGFGMLREYERRNHLPLLDHRIEHLQLLHRDNIKKAAELGITASMQPQHATSDMHMADRYWGERAAYGYLFKTLITSGARVLFGSDAPVEIPNPFWGIHAAVTRRRQDGSPTVEGWYPHERISLVEALAAYSSSAAELDHAPERSGKLVPGALADLLILPIDPSEIDPQGLFTIRPDRVMINGDWIQ